MTDSVVLPPSAPRTVYKLTDQHLRTRGGYQWVLGEWRETSGEGDLCGPGWLHHYSDPLLAVFLNPIHADFENPRLFRAEAAGAFQDDHGLKGGSTRLRLVEELPVPAVTPAQRVRFGILCVWEVTADEAWRAWAAKWLSGEDRTAESAWRAAWATERAAERAAWAAERAAWAVAAAWAAAVAAAWAAAAAERAAERAAGAAKRAKRAGRPLPLAELARRAVAEEAAMAANH